MTWVLGIDFGTSYTTAAVFADGRAEPIEIDGQRRMPSVILVDEDGTIVVGSAAERLSGTRPGRTLREPKRRLGEPTPVVLGGEPYPIVDLVGALLASILAEAVRHQGNEPVEIRLTHPASWGRPRLAELRRAAAVAGMPNVTLVPEPVAAAVAYSAESTPSPAGYVAVYDLGGGTFDTAVLRHTDDGFTIHGRPGGDPRLGGELFDELLARHVSQQLDPAAASAIVASDELPWRQAAANLRSEARNAKETLSTRDYAELLVALPTGLTQVRVTRAELESLISDYIDESVDLLGRAVTDAGVGADELSAIYVTGGASRAPMIMERLQARFPGVDVSRRNDPKMVVALGATMPAATAALDSTREMAVVDEPTVVKGTIVSTEELAVTADSVSAEAPPADETPAAAPIVAAAAIIATNPPTSVEPDVTDAPATTAGTVVEAPDGHTVFDPEPIAAGPSTAPGSFPPPVPLDDSTDDPQPGSSRRIAAMAIAAALVLVLVIGGIVAFSGGDNAKPSASGSGGKSRDPGGSATKATAKSITFDTAALQTGVKADRQWKITGKNGDTLDSTLKFTNPTDKDQLVSYEEIVPKSIAADVSKLTPTPGAPAWTVVKADPIIRYDLKVEAGKSVTVGYTAAIPAEGSSIDRLKKFIADYDAAAEARDKELAAFVKGLDQDGDGVNVPADACPAQPAPGIPNGCPLPDFDTDKDGVPIPTDKCPSQKGGGTANGCPKGVAPTTTTSTTTTPPPPPPPPTPPSVYITGPNTCALNTDCYWTSHVSNATSGTWSSNCGGATGPWGASTPAYRLNAYSAGTCRISLTVNGPGGSASASFNLTFA